MLEILGIEGKSQAHPIPLPDNYLVRRVWCNVGKKRFPVCIIEVEDVDTQKIKILSAGASEYGTLGQGDEVKESKTFNDLAIDLQSLKIKDISIYDKHALAVTEDGFIYGWGYNENRLLAIHENNTYHWNPTKIVALSGFFVHRALASFVHSVVEASPRDGSLIHKQIMTVGKPDDLTYVGVPVDEGKENMYIWHLKSFDGLTIS